MKRFVIRCGSPLLAWVFILLGAACALTTSGTSEQCLENRATIDIGSGSSKILVATVNTCIQKIEKILHQDSASLKFKEALNTNQNSLPDTLLQQTIQTLKAWKKDYKKWNVTSYQAVATEVFRQARNGTDFIVQISQATEIPIQIIDQTEEAKLGFWSAIASSSKSVHEVVVWDIGGGSMQMISYDPDGDYNLYMGKMASVSFKDLILKKKASSVRARTPNPLGTKWASQSVKLAERFAVDHVPAKIKTEIQNKKVVGIGGVHSKSIQNQILQGTKSDSFTYNQETLSQTLQTRSLLSDKDLSSAYPETDVTNLALVLGFMKALNISEVEVISADLTAGLLLMSLATPAAP